MVRVNHEGFTLSATAGVTEEQSVYILRTVQGEEKNEVYFLK